MAPVDTLSSALYQKWHHSTTKGASGHPINEVKEIVASFEIQRLILGTALHDTTQHSKTRCEATQRNAYLLDAFIRVLHFSLFHVVVLRAERNIIVRVRAAEEFTQLTQ